MTKIQAVRKEFDEPFRDVVIRFAEDGYSRNMTAHILDFKSTQHFIDTCERFGLNKYWKPIKQMRPECRGVGPHAKRKYTDGEILAWVAKYQKVTDFRKHAPIDVGTVYYRFGFGGWKDIVRMANER